MERVLLVEDEALERMALRMELESGRYGELQILEAGNGQQALDIFYEKHPEILIVDINIPVISGLDFIKAIQEISAETKILITTTYNKSKYIRTALSLGVTDYLLKPVDYSELYLAIEKCKKLIEKERRKIKKYNGIYRYTQQYILSEMLNGHGNPRLIEEILEFKEEEWNNVRIMIWQPSEELEEKIPDYFTDEIKSIFSSEFSVLAAWIDGQGVLLSYPKEASSFFHGQVKSRVYAREFYKKLCKYHLGKLWIGKPGNDWNQIQENYSIISRKIKEKNAISFYAPELDTIPLCENAERKRLGQKWQNKLYLRDSERLIKSIKRRMTAENAYWPGVELFLDVFEKTDAEVDICSLLKCFENERPFEALKEYLEKYFDSNEKIIEDLADKMEPVKRALKYMERCLEKDITQSSVAEKLGLNPAYFSVLFKKETGHTFADTLTSMRINRALELLSNGERNLDYIAFRCGYTSKKYFLLVFRRKMNMTVTEYLGAKEK